MPRESTIQVFRSSTPGAVPTGLTQGELAVNLADAKIFVGSTTGQSIDIIGRTCVTSVNGATGAISSIAVTGANTFTGLQTMNAGLSAAGSTFSGLTRFAAGITTTGLFVTGGATFSGSNLVAFTTGLTAAEIRVGNQLLTSTIHSTGVSVPLGINNNGGTITRIGDVDAAGYSTYVDVDDTNAALKLNCPQGTITIGDADGAYNGTAILVNDGGVSIDLNGTVNTNSNVSVGGELIVGGDKAHIDAQYTALSTTASNQTIWSRFIGDTFQIPFNPGFRSAELFIQASKGTTFEAQKMIVLHDNTDTWSTEYGVVRNGQVLGTYNTTVALVGAEKYLRLRVTPSLTGTSFRVSSTILPA